MATIKFYKSYNIVSKIDCRKNEPASRHVISLTHMNILALLHPHDRDARISFEPVEHKYTIDADPNTAYTSVTTWVHSHFREFDADGIIKRMMASRNWKQSQYHGMTADAIKAAWDTTRDAAAAAGTAMHYNIECHYNGQPVPAEDTEATEFRYFLQFHADHAARLRPYRTEWTVFDEAVRISGSIDMVFENLDPATGEPDGTLSIYDWKRCKEIKKVPFGAKDYSCSPLIAHVPDTNYWHYCLQLNTYKAILERCYGKRVTDLFLVCLHPNNANGSYQCIRVVDLQAEVAALFEQRRLANDPSSEPQGSEPQGSEPQTSLNPTTQKAPKAPPKAPKAPKTDETL